MKSKYEWQGLPVKVVFGLCNVETNKERPLWWYNYECAQSPHIGDGACISALKVILENGDSFVLSNHFGIGVHKLINGGWPDYAHFSLPNESFQKSNLLKYTKFDLDQYEKYESGRERWQEENYPEDYKKKRALVEFIKK